MNNYVLGQLIDITPTHYITKCNGTKISWNKCYYLLKQELEPQTFVLTSEERIAINKKEKQLKKLYSGELYNVK